MSAWPGLYFGPGLCSPVAIIIDSFVRKEKNFEITDSLFSGNDLYVKCAEAVLGRWKVYTLGGGVT